MDRSRSRQFVVHATDRGCRSPKYRMGNQNIRVSPCRVLYDDLYGNRFVSAIDGFWRIPDRSLRWHLGRSCSNCVLRRCGGRANDAVVFEQSSSAVKSIS